MKFSLSKCPSASRPLGGLLLSTLFSASLMAVDCTSPDISLENQQAVDSFQVTFGGGGTCDTVSGHLSIRGEDIVDLSPLSDLTIVEGTVDISFNQALTGLDGLSGLSSVGGSFRLHNNPGLTGLVALSALTSVGGEIEIRANDELISLEGLSGLTEVIGDLWLDWNPSLTSISGLSRLTSVGGGLYIAYDTALTQLEGLSSLTSVGGDMVIARNPNLADVDDLSALTRVGGILYLWENPVLTQLNGLRGLISAGGVSVVLNPQLTDCSGLIPLIDPIDDGAPGPGPGESGIPDVMDTVDFWSYPGCISIAEILAGAPLSKINAGLSDAWWNPETGGQGIFLIVLPEIRSIYMAWLTFDAERPPADVTAMLGDPGHRWLTAFGSYDGNVAELRIYVTRGGVFDSPKPRPHSEPDGEILLEFSTCNAALAIYDIPSIGRHGAIPLERIKLDNVSLCYELGYATNEDPASATEIRSTP